MSRSTRLGTGTTSTTITVERVGARVS